MCKSSCHYPKGEAVSTIFAHEGEDDSSTEMIDITVVLYKLLQSDAGEEGAVRNGLLPSTYVEQLHERLTLPTSLEKVSQAFVALRQLGLRGNARGLYGKGMEVSRRHLSLDAKERGALDDVDRLAKDLASTLEQNRLLKQENERLTAMLSGLNAPTHDSEELGQR